MNIHLKLIFFFSNLKLYLPIYKHLFLKSTAKSWLCCDYFDTKSPSYQGRSLYFDPPWFLRPKKETPRQPHLVKIQGRAPHYLWATRPQSRLPSSRPLPRGLGKTLHCFGLNIDFLKRLCYNNRIFLFFNFFSINVYVWLDLGH